MLDARTSSNLKALEELGISLPDALKKRIDLGINVASGGGGGGGCCCWLVVVGGWLVVVGCWLLVVGSWLLVVRCWLLVVGCWLLVVLFSLVTMEQTPSLSESLQEPMLPDCVESSATLWDTVGSPFLVSRKRALERRSLLKALVARVRACARASPPPPPSSSSSSSSSLYKGRRPERSFLISIHTRAHIGSPTNPYD